MSEKPVSIVIVDDHPMILAGIKAMVESIEDLNVVGTSDDGAAGVELILEKKPDVALLDVRLPNLNGLEALRRLKEKIPELVVILITASESDLYLVEALRYGASGYLTKDSSRELIRHTVRAALAGGTTISAALMDKAFGLIARSAVNLATPNLGDDELPDLVDLTPRELDVLMRLAKGKTNRAIAKDLHLAEVTIKKHVQSILEKMGVRDRTQAALRGVRLGLID
ncbi:MAG TPA: response regulator transcription factor [Phycisphaerales bacterium]|nr:response regulator transcription factor [Phycisphaerales bacterium]